MSVSLYFETLRCAFSDNAVQILVLVALVNFGVELVVNPFLRLAWSLSGVVSTLLKYACSTLLVCGIVACVLAWSRVEQIVSQLNTSDIIISQFNYTHLHSILFANKE
jgi:hypothetical protein